MSATKRRRKCGIWVVDQIVTCPARSSASTARGSIGAPDVRWLTIRRSTMTSASAKPASRSPPPSDHSWTLFVPIDGWTSASSRSAASGSVTTGRGSYSTTTSSAASTTE